MRPLQEPLPSSSLVPRCRQALLNARMAPSLPRMTMTESFIMSSVAKSPGFFSWFTWQANCQEGRMIRSYSSSVSSLLK